MLFVNNWQSPLFLFGATLECRTLRNDTSGTLVGPPIEFLASLMVFPIMPVTDEIREMYQIESPRVKWITFCQYNPDVLKGDVLQEILVPANEYQIYSAEAWPTNQDYITLELEEVVGT